MFARHRWVVRLLCALWLLIPGTAATAGMLLPNPATGTSPATGSGYMDAAGKAAASGTRGQWTVSLVPNPALYRSPEVGCPWLLPAAQVATAPYNTDPKNPWNFSYAANFNGTFELKTGADAPLGVAQGYAAQIVGSDPVMLGGADIRMTYKPGDGDPKDGDVRWMQVIHANDVAWNYLSSLPAGTFPQLPYNTTVGGQHVFLDDAGPGSTKPKDPYYGWLTATDPSDITTSIAANSGIFRDRARTQLVNGLELQFQTFLVKETDVANLAGGTDHNVTIYGGVWWGFRETFMAAPEPSTWTLMVSGCGIIVFFRRRARQRNGE